MEQIVIIHPIPGASAVTTGLQRFTSPNQQVTTFFDQLLTNWAGGGEWHFDQGGEIVATGVARGLFDHKMLSHPLQTRVYRYDDGTSR